MVDRPHIRISTSLTPQIILVMVAAYFFTHYLQHFVRGPGWLRHYGKDLLLVPMIISAVEITAQFLNKPIAIRTKEVVLAVLAVSVAFEWIIPALSKNQTGDPWDVAMYLAGGLVFLFFTRWGQKMRWSKG